jgi:hypothetical protein
MPTWQETHTAAATRRGARAHARRAGGISPSRQTPNVPDHRADRRDLRLHLRRPWRGRFFVRPRRNLTTVQIEGHCATASAAATRYPSTVMRPTARPPCWKASGIIESASMVRTAPPANASAQIPSWRTLSASRNPAAAWQLRSFPRRGGRGRAIPVATCRRACGRGGAVRRRAGRRPLARLRAALPNRGGGP